MLYKSVLLTMLICWMHIPTVAAKETRINHLNLTIQLDDNWVIKEHPVADLALMNNTTAEAIVIHKVPLSTFNQADQLPQNLTEFKTYIKENYLQSQMNLLSGMLNDETKVKANVSINDMQGPLITMVGKINQMPMKFYMWMAWQGNGAYAINYVSPGFLNREEADFTKLAKKISLTDEQANPFLVSSLVQLDPSKSPLINQQFNLQLSQFEGYILVDNKELELSSNEHFYTFMLINQKNGDFILSIPHCFPMDQATMQATLKTVASFWLDAAYEHGQFDSGGVQVPYIEAHGISEDIKQLSLQATFKQIGDCNHAIMIATSDTLESAQNLNLVYAHLKPLAASQKSVSLMDGQYDQGYAGYYYSIGERLAEEGYDATEFYAAAYQFDPSIEHLNLLLNQINSAGDYLRGLSIIRQSDQNVRQQPVILSWHAWFLQKTEAYEAAIETYAALFATDHQSDEDLLTYLDLLENKQRWQAAHQLVDQHIGNMTRRSTGLGRLIKYAGYNQQPEAVKQTLNLLQEEQRIDLDNIYDVLDGLYEVKLMDTLMSVLDDQLILYPDHVGLTFYKGDIHFVNGEYDQALAAMEKASVLSPDNDRISSYLKNIQLNMGLGNYQLVNQPLEAVEPPKVLLDKIKQQTYQHPDSDVEYLYYTVGYGFQPGEPLTTSYARKIKINNPNGVEQFKTITFDFDQSYEHVYLNEFKVLDEQGKVIQEIDRKSIFLTNNPDGITADDDMVVNIPVPNIRPGVEIEYRITTVSKSKPDEIPYSKHFFVSTYPMSFKAVFIHGETTGINHISRQPLSEHQSTNLLVWSTTQVKELVYQNLMPQLEDMSNWLIINPAQKSWEAIGIDYLQMIDKKLNTTLSKARTMAIFGDARTTGDKVVKAARYIQQNINYQALEFGTRAMIPNTSDQTLQNGYGDCKDHAVLLADLLNSAGIPAHLALVETRRTVNPEMPALDQFNHAVVYLPDYQNGMFIDTTDKELTIGPAYPPENLQGSTALVLDPEKPYLTEIPKGQAQNNTIVVDRELKRSLEHIEITDTIMMTGYKASGMRYTLKNNASNELQQNVQSWIAESYSDLELVSFEYFGLGNNQEPLILELKTRLSADQGLKHLPFFMEKNYLDMNHNPGRSEGYQTRSPFVFKSTTSVSPDFRIQLSPAEVNASDHQATEWAISQQQGKLFFVTENKWYQGSPESYNQYVTTMKKAINQLENSIQLSE
ncbi:DUF3857 domain-containing protein [Marinicella sediminis]|uniref:DUF3857 domain-containing protein n=1 Tax=Marinicella sediminis TaxID=1792834 RepID=A0ABV7JAY6_9GAMM|nr:DUF3857 domain-containing protein [Marinicella sediminis]